MVRLDAEALENVDEKVGQRVVALAIEDEMPAVLEAAAREQNGQVGRHMRIRVTEVAAVEHHGAIQQGFAALSMRFQISEETCQQLHMFAIDHLKLRQFLRISAMMREVMIAVRYG